MHRNYSWRLSAANKMELQAFDGRARTVPLSETSEAGPKVQVEQSSLRMATFSSGV
jgi:hypothetical protein